MPNSNACLCVALDYEDRRSFLATVKNFEDLDLVVKIGLRLLPKLRTEDFEYLKEQGIPFFIDAKLYDIPSQVKSAVHAWAKLGASYLTVHLSSGRSVLMAAQEAAKQTDMTILGVSVLTSMDDAELKELGVEANCKKQVRRLVSLGLSCGIKSFVSSVAEVQAIKEIVPNAFCVCPGIRLAGESQHSDQKRSYTVAEAVSKGVSMLVVGRSVYQADNPRAVAKKIISEIS
ncbi:orotidine-5'-phosphate decarboxylase [bacterium]|nr:orotidine-5'-phosphate decarboxylase [bacterium]